MRNFEKSSSSSSVLASPNQLAAIQALQKNIRLLALHLNRPYSMGLSLLIFPPLISLCLLSDKSPFKDTILEYHYEKAYNHPSFKLFGEYDHAEIERYYEEFQVWEEKLEKFAAISHEEDGIASLGRSKTSSQNAEYFEAAVYQEKDQQKAIKLLTDIKRSLIKDYEMLALPYRDIPELIKQYRSRIPYNVLAPFLEMDQIGGKMLSEQELLSLPLYKLTNLLHKQYQFFLSDFPKRLDYSHKFMSGIFASGLLQTSVRLTQIALTILAQYFVVNPTFNHFFPYGIFQPKAPQKKEWLTKEEAKSLISALELHQSILNKKTKRNVKFARYISTIILPLAIYLLMSTSDPSPQLVIFALTLIATAMTDVRQDLAEIYQSRVLKKQLLRESSLWKKVTEDYPVILEMVEGDFLNSSYFILKFKSQTLPGKKLARLFKDCCLYHKVNIIAQQNDVVSLPFQSGITVHKTSLIQKMFIESVERYGKCGILINQIKEVNVVSNIGKKITIFVNPGYDEHHLPIVFIDIWISISDQKHLPVLKESFMGNEFKVVEQDTLLHVSIVGICSADMGLLTRFCTLLKDKEQNIDTAQPDVKLKPLQKKNKSKVNYFDKNNSEIFSSSPQSSLPPKIIFWKDNSKYDSSDKNCNIYPVSFGNVKTYDSLSKTKLFIKNGLDSNAVPENIYRAIDEHVTDPKLVSSKGGQGLVFWHSMERDQNGDWFETAAKLKLLGRKGKGKIRGYLQEEKANTGETLWVVNGINYKTH